MTTKSTTYPAALEARLVALLSRPQEITPSDIDRRTIASHPISTAVRDVLVYFVTVEGLTPTYEAMVRANPAVEGDGLIDRFLATWRREELNHSAMLAAFLEHAPVDDGDGAVRIGRPDLEQEPGGGDRLTAIACRLPLVGRPLADALLGAHMAWGGLQESLTNWGYSTLRKGTGHPELKRIITSIKRDEHKHQAFYYAQAEWRLGHSAATRLLTRTALRSFYAPVGVSERGPVEFGRVAERLIELSGKPVESAEPLNDRLRTLPGLASVRVVVPAIERTREAYLSAAA